MKTNFFSITATILCLSGLALSIIYVSFLLNKAALKQPKEKHCMTYSQFVYAQAKYELYVDSLQIGNKKHNKRYTDSVIKYSIILKQND